MGGFRVPLHFCSPCAALFSALAARVPNPDVDDTVRCALHASFVDAPASDAMPCRDCAIARRMFAIAASDCAIQAFESMRFFGAGEVRASMCMGVRDGGRLRTRSVSPPPLVDRGIAPGSRPVRPLF